MKIRTGYSFKTAVGHAADVADRIKEMGWKYAPVCDRLSTFSFVTWTKLCKERNLKPVYGAELPVVAEQGAKKPVVDYWAFFAEKDLRPLHEAIAVATRRDGLTYEQAQSWPGLIKISGERCLLDRVGKKAKNFFVALGPSTPKGLYEAARKRLFTFVATGDNYYTREEDKEFYRIALGMRSSTQTYPMHILTDEELRAACWYADDVTFRRAVVTRDKILRGCSGTELRRATLYVPEKKKSLRRMCEDGAKRLGVSLSEKVYRDRLARELSLIAEKEFEDYFFIIADFMQWARARMIVGPARGSSCGSLVCYLLGITSVDPIVHNLVFERFIDTTRKDLPDIDLDFSDARRQMVFDYVENKYGKDHVARLGSVNNIMGREALRILGPALRIPQWQMTEISNSMVFRTFGDSRAALTIGDALRGTDMGKRVLREYPAAIVATKLENHPANAGQHAAGLILTKDKVVDVVAVDTSRGVAMCNKYDAETLNLLKIDMLGLSQLSVLERTMELIGKPTNNEFLESLPLTTQKAYDVLNDQKFAGIFQFAPGSPSAGLIERLVITMGARLNHIEDIVSMTALVRPGPLGSGAAESWMKRRAGKEKVTLRHPALAPYLEKTMGIIIYQEQVMQIGKEIGGLSWEDVTALRKAMSKSLGKEYFDQFGDRWKEGAKRTTGMSDDAVDKFWEDLCQYGMWAFNRSHSVAYGIMSYWCCWLKAHYPVEFAAATLDAEDSQTKQIAMLNELRREGVDYVPVDPDLSTDRWEIAKRGKKTYLVGPLGNIMGVGPQTVRDVMTARRSGEALRPSLRKKLENASTKLDSLTPIADAIAKMHPDMRAVGVVTRPQPIGSVDVNSGIATVVGKAIRVVPLDENEPSRVARRGGRKYSGPTKAVNVFLKDDTGDILCKIDRFSYEQIGKRVAAQAKTGSFQSRDGKSIFAVRGEVPQDYRMIRVHRIKYLGDMGMTKEQIAAAMAGLGQENKKEEAPT